MNADVISALDSTAAFLRRYVVFASPEQADACALWVGHSWLYDQFDVTPYLAIQSPEKRSGKTLLQDCLEIVVREPLATGGASLAAIFRAVNEWHPTLLMDEVDTIFSRKADNTEDLRGLLNSGYRRGRPYLRIVGEGKKMRVEKFETYAPKCLASIHSLPDTIEDRSIVIHLQRKLASEKVERFRSRRAEREAIPVKESWEAIAQELELPEYAEVPAELSDRAADSWEPLLALADAAGGEWPARARRAALVLSGVIELDDEKIPILLLADIRDVFTGQGVERIATKLLMERLLSDDYEMHPWQEWNNGRGLKPTGMGRLLTPFGIHAQQLRIDGPKVRGYELAQFADAFSRYLPPPRQGPFTRYTGTSERESEHERTGVPVQTPTTGGAETTPDADEKPVARPRGNGSATSSNGGLHHTCRGCHEAITDMADGYFDGRTSTFWHRGHWAEHAKGADA